MAKTEITTLKKKEQKNVSEKKKKILRRWRLGFVEVCFCFSSLVSGEDERGKTYHDHALKALTTGFMAGKPIYKVKSESRLKLSDRFSGRRRCKRAVVADNSDGGRG